MLNEGLIVSDTAAVVKSEMVKQIRRLGPSSPEDLERAVFEALTGHRREDVDWDIEDNRAGYFTWVKSFDQLLGELVEDGYIRVDQQHGLTPTEAEPQSHYPQAVRP